MSKPSQLYDPIRKIWVKATPEERVRQKILRLMIEERGYPPGLIGVEVSLRQLLKNAQNLPQRRIDLIAYTQAMRPLLVVECKATPLTSSTLDQVKDYNYFLKTPFIGVANEENLRIGWLQGIDWQWVEDLPTYLSLSQSL